MLIQLTVSILTFRFSLGAHFNSCISPLPKCANIGTEGRLRTLSVPHIIALYESFVVRTGSTDADLRLRFGDVHLIFFPATSFFSSSPKSSHEGVSHVSFISLP